MRAGREQPAASPGERHVAGAPLLDELLILEGLPELPHDAVEILELGQDVGVAAELEVHGLPTRRGVVLQQVRRQQVLRETGDEHVVELQALGLMDRHHLHRVLLGRLDRRPLRLLALLHRVDVVQERAKRELALHR